MYTLWLKYIITKSWNRAEINPGTNKFCHYSLRCRLFCGNVDLNFIYLWANMVLHGFLCSHNVSSRHKLHVHYHSIIFYHSHPIQKVLPKKNHCKSKTACTNINMVAHGFSCTVVTVFHLVKCLISITIPIPSSFSFPSHSKDTTTKL